MLTENNHLEKKLPGSRNDRERQARTWATFCHLSALLGLIWVPMTGFAIPFGNLIGPLVIWLIKKNDFPLVDEQGKESLNFQLSMTIYGIISSLLILVIIGFFLILALALIDIVLVVIASIKVSNGEPYRYPLTIRLIK